MICPIVATALTANDPTDISGWRTLFLTTVGLYVVTWLLYIAFVKIKPLPFDDQSEEKLAKQKYKEITAEWSTYTLMEYTVGWGSNK